MTRKWATCVSLPWGNSHNMFIKFWLILSLKFRSNFSLTCCLINRHILKFNARIIMPQLTLISLNLKTDCRKHFKPLFRNFWKFWLNSFTKLMCFFTNWFTFKIFEWWYAKTVILPKIWTHDILPSFSKKILERENFKNSSSMSWVSHFWWNHSYFISSFNISLTYRNEELPSTYNRVCQWVWGEKSKRIKINSKSNL